MNHFTPPNEHYKTVVTQIVGSMPAAKSLGFTFHSLEPGRCVLELKVRPELTEHQGWFQGGAIGSLIDFSGGSACGTMLKPGHLLMTLDYSVKLLRPANSEVLFAEGIVLSSSQLLSTAEVSVWKGEIGHDLCAKGLVSTRNIEPVER